MDSREIRLKDTNLDMVSFWFDRQITELLLQKWVHVNRRTVALQGDLHLQSAGRRQSRNITGGGYSTTDQHRASAVRV